MNDSTAWMRPASVPLQRLQAASPTIRGTQAHAPPDAADAWAKRSLDRVDEGIALLDAEGRVLFANRSARSRLRGGAVLFDDAGRLAARRPADAAALRAGLADAAGRGLYRLLRLGPDDVHEFVALSPLDRELAPRRVLCKFGRRGLCNPLALQCYASSFRLSSAESNVLRQLCDGADPHAIARRQGVALSTVRTQIAAIRGKTGTRSVGDLLRTLARLPAVGGLGWYQDCAA